MGAAADKLTSKVRADDRFDYKAADVRALQVEALNERFQERKDCLKLLAHRANEAQVTEIRAVEDMVPLLFPHTAYKSYPESFLMEERWDRLTRWLGTVSPYKIEGVDLDGIADIDDWIDRLSAKGYFISCSSGTTGKSAMLIASQKDMDWSTLDTVGVFSWGSGVVPRQDKMMIGCAPVATVPKNTTISKAQYAAFANPAWPRFNYPVPPITVGSLTKMVVMRKKISDGTATPQEIADFERTSKERQEVLDKAIIIAAEEIIANRDKDLMVSGLWSGLFAVATAVRERGYTAKDFTGDNCIYVGGGLKRALLPDDYQEFVHQTFNIPHDRDFQNYSMQELNSGMPKCRECGRYHVPPWIVPMILDKDGDNLLPYDLDGGEIEGRAAFFDLALDGRWGGIITGDRISIDYAPDRLQPQGPVDPQQHRPLRRSRGRRQDRLRGHDRCLCARRRRELTPLPLKGRGQEERTMGAAADKLVSHMPGATGFALSHDEVRETQVAAMNERLAERIDKIKLVGLRARDAGVDRDPQPGGSGSAAAAAHRLQELSGRIPDREEVGQADQVARHRVDLSHRWRGPHRCRRDRRLGRGLREGRPLRRMFERHDGQVGDAGRLAEGRGFHLPGRSGRGAVGLGPARGRQCAPRRAPPAPSPIPTRTPRWAWR